MVLYYVLAILKLNQSHMFSTCYLFEPPNPVPKYYYRCDKAFHLNDLMNLYVVYDTYAVILISGKRTDLYSYSKNNIQLIKSIESILPNQHKTGGSSAARMGRIRDEKINLYVKNIAELMFLKLIKDNIFQHLGLLVAGPGELKSEIQNNILFQQHFQKHLLKVMTISEITDNSIHEVCHVLSEIVYGVNTELIEKFESLIVNKMDLLIFGDDVLEQLTLGNLEEIYIDGDSLDIINVIKNEKTIVHVMNDTFTKKYGKMVGVKYYVDIFEEI